MKKFYLGLLLFIFSFASFAQENNFYISNTYFDGQKVKFFSENRGGAVVVLDDDRMYVMNRNQEFSEVTALFEAGTLQDITCVESVNERLFLVGTLNNSLLMYEDGEVTKLKDLNPELPLQINSIDFSGNSSNKQVLLATNDNIWVSNDMKYYTRSELKYTRNPKFYSGRSTILLTDYSSCNRVPGKFGLQYSSYGTTLFRLFEKEGFDIKKLNDVIYAKGGLGSGTYNTYAYYGTNDGIYAQHVHSCSTDTSIHFTNTTVHDLQIVSSGLTKSALFAASDSGLLFMEASNDHYFNVYDPEYFSLEGIDSAYTINYSRYHNTIWVGTNDGLLQVFDDQLTQESLEPGIIEFDTIDFCMAEGTHLSVALNDQLDIQWYRDGEKIEGALSKVYHTQDGGLYSIKFTYEDQLFEYDVAYARLDSTFNERIRKQDYLMCPTDPYAFIEIDNVEYWHNYTWYSVERGLELEAVDRKEYYAADEGGHYYFVSTNCNGYTYHSDTIEVIKSQLAQPSFSSDLSEQIFCSGDTIFVNGIDNAVNFSWRVGYERINEYNKPFIILEPGHSEENLSVITSDRYGCELTVSTYLGIVFDPPSLSIDQQDLFICEPEDFVYFDLPFGSSAIWEGFKDGVHQKVGPGNYPVIVSNGACPDFEVNVQINYFDPLSNLNLEDTVFLVNDTLKIPVNDSYPLNWNWPFQQSTDKSFIYITSIEPDTIQAEIWIPSSDCYQYYSFNLCFKEPSLLGLDDNISNINIYPNPSSDGVMIEMNQSDIVNIQLLDLNGRIIIDKRNENGEKIYFTFPPDLKNGAYVLRIIRSNYDYVTRKVIIK